VISRPIRPVPSFCRLTELGAGEVRVRWVPIGAEMFVLIFSAFSCAPSQGAQRLSHPIE
jgi:hypothetical protein